MSLSVRWEFYCVKTFGRDITIEKSSLGVIKIEVEGRFTWRGIETKTIRDNADQRICPECLWIHAWRCHGDCWSGKVRYVHSWGTWRDSPGPVPRTNRRHPPRVSLEARETCWGKARESWSRPGLHVNTITDVNSRIVMYLIRRGSIGALSVYVLCVFLNLARIKVLRISNEWEM